MGNTYRAAVIGSTGRGDYGHGLDTVWLDVPGAELVAVADDNPEGLRAAGERLGVDHLYEDYRLMLAHEEIDVVSVAPRWLGQHEAMVVACAEAGRHIYCEKPLAPDAATCDRMLAACRSAGVKIAVAHQNRASLAVRRVREMIQSGALGEILCFRGRGKEDSRGGGQDLMVLGTHMLDLMCFLAGQPRWAFAHITQGGRDATPADAVEGAEEIGPIMGDRISVMYGFDGGVHGYFETVRNMPATGDRFFLEVQGSEGCVQMRSMRDEMHLAEPMFNPARQQVWQPVGPQEWIEREDRIRWSNRELVLDLLRAAEEGREPISSGADAARAVEMIQAVYASHLSGAPVALPLAEREHPLRTPA